MLATLAGDLCLLVGLAVLLLPLLATELSRPRDGAWGAVVLVLGLVLVTSSDRLRGAPMLAVACAALLIGRLGSEVARARWNQLSVEEQKRLSSRERWATSVQQLISAISSLGSNAGGALANLTSTPATPHREGASKSGKRWVRPEDASNTTPQGSSEERDDAGATTMDITPLAEEVEDLAPPPTATSSSASTDFAQDSPTPDTAATKGFGAPGKRTKGKGKRWVRPEPEPETEPETKAEITSDPEPMGSDPEPTPSEGTGQD